MATNPTLLTMPIAENGQKNTIPATQAAAGDGLLSQSTGFPPETALPLGAGGKAPTREDFNGAFNLLSDIAFYAQKGWTFQYDATQDYFKGCIVIDPSDGLRYECLNDMVAGTVSPHEDTNNDYWKVFSTGGGVAVGFIMPYAGTGLQEGWLDCDGSAVSRTMYPDLFAKLGTKWGAGDGSTTFNLPRSEDLVLQGASATNPVGTYLQAGLPNIEGVLTDNEGESLLGPENAPLTENGSLGVTYDAGLSVNSSTTTTATYATKSITFDASKSNAIYGASATVQPPAACVRYMIKAFDGQTPDSALIDITQYASDLANKADRSLSNLNSAGEQKLEETTKSVVYEDGFAIIYPNGGSESSPANVTKNTRYVEINPFPGYDVYCIVELYYNGEWGESRFSSGNSAFYGIEAFQYDDSIVLVAASSSLLVGASINHNNPFNLGTSADISTAPCRVKVFKIGKVGNS